MSENLVGNGFKNRFEHPTLIFARFCRYREKKIFQVRNLEILSLNNYLYIFLCTTLNSIKMLKKLKTKVVLHQGE